MRQLTNLVIGLVCLAGTGTTLAQDKSADTTKTTKKKAKTAKKAKKDDVSDEKGGTKKN